jgi:peptidoglycan/LPS O-acetylase OafA/YrhL
VNVNKTMQGRLNVFDFLRALATLAVIGIHVSANYADTSPGGLFFNQLVRFAVPMFVIISGYLLYFRDLSAARPESAARFYQKRFSKILWPYLLWTVFYTLLTQYLLRIWPDPLTLAAAAGKHLLWGTAGYHLYFMVIIIQCYLLYPLLRVWLQRYPHKALLILFVIGAVCQAWLYLHSIGRYPLPQIAYPQIYMRAFPSWIFYFGLGMYAAHFREQIESGLAAKRLLWGSFWGASLLVLLWESRMTASFATSAKPTIMVYAVISFFFFYSVALQYSAMRMRCVEWFSRQSFLVYLSHPVVLLFLERIVHKIGRPYAWDGVSGMLLLYVLTVVITIGVIYGLRFLPGLSLLGGQSSRRDDCQI